MFLDGMKRFAELIGANPSHAEDALYSDRAARLTLSRRGLFGIGAALAVGSAFSFAPPGPMSSVILLLNGNVVQGWKPGARICGFNVFGTDRKSADPDALDKYELFRVDPNGKRHPGYLDHGYLNPRSIVCWQGEAIVA